MKATIFIAATLIAVITAKPNYLNQNAEILSRVGQFSSEDTNNKPSLVIAHKPMKVVRKGFISLLSASVYPIAQFEVLAEDVKPAVPVENDAGVGFISKEETLTDMLGEKDKNVLEQDVIPVNIQNIETNQEQTEKNKEMLENEIVEEIIEQALEQQQNLVQNQNINEKIQEEILEHNVMEQVLDTANIIEQQKEHLEPNTVDEIKDEIVQEVEQQPHQEVKENNGEQIVEQTIVNNVAPELQGEQIEVNKENNLEQNIPEQLIEQDIPEPPLENNPEQTIIKDEENLKEKPEAEGDNTEQVLPDTNVEQKGDENKEKEESGENIFQQMFHAVSNFFTGSDSGEENKEKEGEKLPEVSEGEKVEEKIPAENEVGDKLVLSPEGEKLPEETEVGNEAVVPLPEETEGEKLPAENEGVDKVVPLPAETGENLPAETEIGNEAAPLPEETEGEKLPSENEVGAMPLPEETEAGENSPAQGGNEAVPLPEELGEKVNTEGEKVAEIKPEDKEADTVDVNEEIANDNNLIVPPSDLNTNNLIQQNNNELLPEPLPVVPETIEENKIPGEIKENLGENVLIPENNLGENVLIPENNINNLDEKIEENKIPGEIVGDILPAPLPELLPTENDKNNLEENVEVNFVPSKIDENLDNLIPMPRPVVPTLTNNNNLEPTDELAFQPIFFPPIQPDSVKEELETPINNANEQAVPLQPEEVTNTEELTQKEEINTPIKIDQNDPPPEEVTSEIGTTDNEGKYFGAPPMYGGMPPYGRPPYGRPGYGGAPYGGAPYGGGGYMPQSYYPQRYPHYSPYNYGYPQQYPMPYGRNKRLVDEA